MPDVLAVVGRWWKRIAAFTLLVTIVALILTSLLPKQYVSIATALPASSMAADKAAIFNTNIQQLYSPLGTPDDLDRILGTAHLDTIYIATARALNLPAHYGLEANRDGLESAVQKLKHHTTISKSEWGELKIKVWDTDRNVSARLANTLLQALQQLHQDLQNRSNQLVLQKLKEAYQAVQQPDSIKQNATAASAVKMTTAGQLQDFEKLMAQYSLIVTTNPPVLLVVENARPALYPDNARQWTTVLLAFFAAFLFALLLALYIEGKKAGA